MIMPSIIHTLTATAIGTFTAGKILTINGWEGTYTAPGATATKGKIIIKIRLLFNQSNSSLVI